MGKNLQFKHRLRDRVEIIAEVANAHQGEVSSAERIAVESLTAGADAVKFQVYFAQELLVRSHPRFLHFKKQGFTPEKWVKLISGVKKHGATVYCDVFGVTALEVAEAAGADGFKVHSSDLSNLPLLRALAELGKPVFLSTGGSTAFEISYALNELIPSGIDVVLLHGFQSYPTALKDSSLCRLQWLKDQFGAIATIGFQDHVSGDDVFASMLPIMAVGMGARVIEKHVTLDRNAKGVDYYSSLEPAELSMFILNLRRAEGAIGELPTSFSEAELRYRWSVKKQWVAARNLASGTVLDYSDLVMKRLPESSDGAATLEQFAGRVLLQDIIEERAITRADVRNQVWALVVARSRSSRLPNKAVLEVNGDPVLVHLFKRLKQARRIDKILFCTTLLEEDQKLVDIANSVGIDSYRGPVEDVLGRMLGAVGAHKVDIIVRVTGDDILVDPDYIDSAIEYHLSSNSEYTDLKALPSGTEVEVLDLQILQQIHMLARDPCGTEYLTNYVIDNRSQFRTSCAPVNPNHRREWRLTLDTQEDFQVIKKLLEAMYAMGKGLTYRLDDIVNYFLSHPEVLELNASIGQRKLPIGVDTHLEWGKLVKHGRCSA